MRYTFPVARKGARGKGRVGIISDDDIQKVREATDIVALIGERSPVRQRGRDFWCCCPLHNEKTPSLKMDPSTQLWHCFGCNAGGDVFGFVMQADDLTFPEAVRKLADRAHIELSEDSRSGGLPRNRRERLKAVCRETADYYHLQLMRGKSARAQAARDYLASRGLGGRVPNDWRLGFAPGRGSLVRHLSSKGFSADEMVQANVAVERNGRLNDRFYDRVMFPINDVQGECIAFGGRVIEKKEPKYLNSQETSIFHKSQTLYGLDHAKAAMAATGCAVVVEGYTDVILLHEAGLKNVVATLGTALTQRHLRVLSRHAQHRIVYLFDGDAAGQRAADRALQFIDGSMTPEAGRSKVELAAVTLPDDLDPADFVSQRGADALRALIDGAQPLVQYGIDRRIERHDLSRPEGRSAAMADALSVLAPIKDSLLAKDYAVQIAGRVRAREQDVLDALAKLESPRRFSDDGAERHGVQNGALGTDAPSPAPAPRKLSASESSRLRFERELLSLVAHHPQLGLSHADALASTQWHDPVHEAVAQGILDVLAADGQAQPACIVSEVSRKVPQAARILTSGQMGGQASPEDLATFLAEELAVGDTEEAIAGLRARLADPRGLSPDELDFIFQSVAGMQKDLTQRKLAHKPLAKL
ncbi:MAG: DNA primase [Eggerthellaceae bacterium]|nr:DNA primase [Eggerthellaceae bacterium]